MNDKSMLQLLFMMRCCESLLNGSVRIHSELNHDFIIEQLVKADELLLAFDAIPHTDRYWADEMIADETYFALRSAVTTARKYIRSTVKLVRE